MSGVDHYGAVAAGEDFSIINVWTTNELDAQVRASKQPLCYVEVKYRGNTIAKRLPATPTDEKRTEGPVMSQDKNENGRDHLVQISIKNLDLEHLGWYQINVYSDQEGDELLYSGKLSGVYAQLGENGPRNLIGLRVMNDNEKSRVFQADAIYFEGSTEPTGEDASTNQGKTWQLNTADKANTGTSAPGEDLVFQYTESNGTTISADVKYVDADGEEIAVTNKGTVPLLLESSPTGTYTVPDMVTSKNDDGTTQYWRTIVPTRKLTFTYPDKLSHTVLCRPITFKEALQGTPFTATILYQVENADGSVTTVMKDQVLVSEKTLYTLPMSFCQTQPAKDGKTEAVTYVLAEGQDSVLVFDPTMELTDDQKTVVVKYRSAVSDDSVVWTIKKKIAARDTAEQQGDGSWRPVTLDDLTETIVVARGTEETRTFDESIEYQGQTYVPWGNTKRTYSYTSDRMPVDTVYYVPEGEAPAGEYDVTVQYVNIANGKRIGGYTVKVSSDMLEDIKIGPEPERISFEGNEYVRLAGQDAPFYHGFFDEYRTYTIYYRDVNDTAYANVVITRTQIIRNTAGANDEDAWQTGLVEGANLSAVGFDTTVDDAAGEGVAPDDGLLLNEEGVDTATERIDDDDVALASGPEGAGAEGANAFAAMTTPQLIAVSVAALLALAAVGYGILFFWRKKKQQPQAATVNADGNDENNA